MGASPESGVAMHWAHPGFEGLLGVARRDITPPSGIFFRCWGPATLDTPLGVHRPLTLTALALRAAEVEPLVLISADLGWWQQIADERHIRASLLEALGLTEERVLINLSHTHSGPSLCSSDAQQPGGHLIAPYLDALRDAAISAAREAIAGAKPGRLEWANGLCDLAVNRDLPIDQRYYVGFNPAGDADATLLVGRVTRFDGTLVATLVNYACHPTTLAWQNELISPDYVGAMREVIEQASGGAPCMFLQGASGELAPREGYVGDPGVADRHGRRLGYAALSVLSGMLAPRTELAFTQTIESGAPLALWEPVERAEDGRLAAVCLKVRCELKKLPSLERLEQLWQGVEQRSLRERLARAERQQAIYAGQESTLHPAWVWRIGGAALIAHPGEAYSHLQRRLRAGRPDQAVVVCNVTNGPGWVYLPPREAYATDRYSVWQTVLAAGSLERLEEACERELAELMDLPPIRQPGRLAKEVAAIDR
jgi:hypothetical protein